MAGSGLLSVIEPYFALALEWLGHDTDIMMRNWEQVEREVGVREGDGGKWHNRRPWVAEIDGLSERYGLNRRWIDGRTDYTHANARLIASAPDLLAALEAALVHQEHHALSTICVCLETGRAAIRRARGED